MDIYQRIWDADQTGSGLRPILHGAAPPDGGGFVRVLSTSGQGAPETRILSEVELPVGKERTYGLVRALFDNYSLDEQHIENETADERAEVHNLLEAIIDTAPMQVARAYIAEETGTTISRDRMYATLTEQWFRRFNQGGDRDLSGFEHVFVGEQEGPKVQGYHFWYKYHLDDGLAREVPPATFPGLDPDRIIYVRGLYENGQENFPESVTISFKWMAPDYDAGQLRPLTKPIGGFFVGCSVEGLLALGTVRAHRGARAPKEAVINGARYDLKLFLDPSERHIRTFYPVFLGAASGTSPDDVVTGGGGDPVDVPRHVTGPVRILSALVNPMGHDEGRELVTLVNTGVEAIDLDGWFLVDAMSNRLGIKTVLQPGMAETIILPRHSIQLSNKGGQIRLMDRAGSAVHLVSYSKSQASRQGETIVF